MPSVVSHPIQEIHSKGTTYFLVAQSVMDVFGFPVERARDSVVNSVPLYLGQDAKQVESKLHKAWIHNHKALTGFYPPADYNPFKTLD